MSHTPTHSVIVTGAKVGGGSVKDPRPEPRLNIKDLLADDMQRSLYIQALNLLQSASPRIEGTNDINPMSWFGLASIHGLPHESWDNAQIVRNARGDVANYCTHASVLFPTWHRAYLAVFEQAVQGAALQVALDYPTVWQEAAARLRIPYWDWATDALPPREVWQQTHIEIRVPGLDGSTDPLTVPNPLYSYKFQEPVPYLKGAEPDTETVRHSDSPDHSAFVEDLEALHRGESDLVRQKRTLQSDVHRMLLDQKTWASFSNKRATPSDLAINSIETLHDWIHVTVGGNGTMSSQLVAAFDPIFWLHHANVDRLMALWQAVHPDVWVTADDRHNAKTDLLPFWNSARTYYNSGDKEMQDWAGLYYTYPEFLNAPADSEGRRTEIRKQIKALYNQRTSSSEFTSLRTTNLVVNQLAAVSPHLPSESWLPSQTLSTDYLIRVRTRRFSINMSYSILFFFGNPPEHVSEWRTSPNFVGRYMKFVNTNPEGCENCMETMENDDMGFVDITDDLARKVQGNVKQEAEEFLSKELQWRIQKVDGSLIDPAEVTGLTAEILAVPTQWSEEDECFRLVSDTDPTVFDFKLQGHNAD